jgi:excisionase family DNA binding protein
MMSVEQVAERLGLHVRTVRGYVRDGRLKAVRIGKQYRIAPDDLEAFTGRTSAVPATARHTEVSSIVQVDGIDPAAADRLSTLLVAGGQMSRDPADPLRIQTMYDRERARMKIVILGGPAVTADVLHLIDGVLGPENGLLDPAGAAGTPGTGDDRG